MTMAYHKNPGAFEELCRELYLETQDESLFDYSLVLCSELLKLARHLGYSDSFVVRFLRQHDLCVYWHVRDAQSAFLDYCGYPANFSLWRN